MPSTGNWKPVACAFVALCLLVSQLQTNAWAADSVNTLKIVVANDDHDNGRDIRVNVRSGDVPVSGAEVVFDLPSTGPSGVFSNGSRSRTVVTDAGGTAHSGTIHLNDQSGPFSVLVAARQGAATGQTSVQTSNPTPADKSKHGSRKKWFIIAGIVGAAVAIVLVSKSKPEADVTVGAPSVGAPQ